MCFPQLDKFSKIYTEEVLRRKIINVQLLVRTFKTDRQTNIQNYFLSGLGVVFVPMKTSSLLLQKFIFSAFMRLYFFGVNILPFQAKVV